MKKYLTGIGSRKIPSDIFKLLIEYSAIFCRNGYILRSGGADGADNACEIGCDSVSGEKEIYLPWKEFNKNSSSLYNIPKEAYAIAQKYHPIFNKLKPSVKKLHSRNVSQILGQNLQTPSNLVLCYTENGEVKGGTATALKIAKDYNIPIYNLGIPETENALDLLINTNSL
jgi:hypothetical protein